MNLSNLTFADAERFAYINGQPFPQCVHDATDELEGAKAFADIALDTKGIDTPQDLEAQLCELHHLRGALPDGVSDANELRRYVSEQEAIANERDELLSALETLQQGAQTLALKARKQRISGAHLQGLYEWIYYAANERQSIDPNQFNNDLGINE